MHSTVQKLIVIENKIKSNLEDLKINNLPKIIAVSKTFKLDEILPLIDHGHTDFGENKIQEAIEKWTDIKEKNTNIQLHMIGKLQTNKVKLAVKLFDYIHSVDTEKINKKIKIFIQVNIGKENQKTGIDKDRVSDLVIYCKKINLNVVGLMCIPPVDQDPTIYFKEIFLINKKLNFSDLSMGMSSDYIQATQNGSTYLRIGSSIFGKRF